MARVSDDPDPIGTVADEAMKLVFALTTSAGSRNSDSSNSESTDHVCNNGWCPLCQMANYIRDNPEAVERVTHAAATLTRSLRDLLEQLAPHQQETP